SVSHAFFLLQAAPRRGPAIPLLFTRSLIKRNEHTASGCVFYRLFRLIVLLLVLVLLLERLSSTSTSRSTSTIEETVPTARTPPKAPACRDHTGGREGPPPRTSSWCRTPGRGRPRSRSIPRAQL